MDEKTNVFRLIPPDEKELSKDALQLVKLFIAIPRRDHRRQVIDLAEKLSAESAK